MRVFVNELALCDACSDASPRFQPLEELLALREEWREIRDVLYCTRALPTMEISPGQTVASVAWRMPRDRRQLLFAWVNKYGPFIESDRQFIEDDLFFFEATEVTDLGLGEAGRRVVAGHLTAVVSVIRRQSRFKKSPLVVIQGFPEEPISKVEIENYWEGAELTKTLRLHMPEPRTWAELLTQCRSRFERLVIGEYCDDVLRRYPYRPESGRMAIRLFGVLNDLMGEMKADGSLSQRGERLRQRYFVGRKAWFSDESRGRKANPKRFTFPDPTGRGELCCYWHGKIRSSGYRVHFVWPVPTPGDPLKVVYFGPHL